jgi:hypothetical protein
LSYASFFTPFEPQLLVGDAARSWTVWVESSTGEIALGGLGYDFVLIGFGLVWYVVACVVFASRDLPAPL